MKDEDEEIPWQTWTGVIASAVAAPMALYAGWCFWCKRRRRREKDREHRERRKPWSEAENQFQELLMNV